MIWSVLSIAIAVATWLTVVQTADLSGHTQTVTLASFTATGLACGLMGVRNDKSDLNGAVSKLAVAMHVLIVLCRYSYHGQEFAQKPDGAAILHCTLTNSAFVGNLVRRGYVWDGKLHSAVTSALELCAKEKWLEPIEGYDPSSCHLVEVDLPNGYPPGLICSAHDFYFAYDGRTFKTRASDHMLSIGRASF